MPIRDVAAMNASLDNDYGTSHGSNSPTSGHEVALLDADGNELSGGGYARVVLAHSGWEPADNGYKNPTNPIQFPATSGSWPEEAVAWALFSHDDSVTMWDYGPLTNPLDVTAASTAGPVLTFSVYYSEILEP